MKILVVNWQDISHPLSGGAEVHLFETFSRIASRGHEVTLLCCRYENSSPHEVIQGIHVHRMGTRGTFNLSVPFGYRSLRRRSQFDAVVEDLNKIPFYGRFFIRQPKLNLVHHLFGKTIYSETWCLPASYVYLAEKSLGLAYRTERFVAVSESAKQDLIALGIAEKQIAVVYNGVDHELYRRRGLEAFERPTVCFVGRLKRYKNIGCVIQAAAQVARKIPNVRFLIIGEGDHRPSLVRLAERLGLQGVVEFTGFVDEHRKAELLERSQVAVNPSPKEGWGLTNIEANACGTPVIAANSPGLRDSVRDGQSGMLFKYDNVEELSAKIEQVLGDRALRARLSEGALKWAETFSWDRSAALMLELLERVRREAKGSEIPASS